MNVTLVSNTIRVGKVRSTDEAATEMDHGDTLCTRDGWGAEFSFPAEKTTVIPSCIAWNDPMSVEDLKNGGSGTACPKEAEIKWTPSLKASLNPANISASLHISKLFWFQQVLYTASRALGAPPRAVPSPIPWKFALCTMDPTAVEAVWVPWPSQSRGDLYSELASRGPISFSRPVK